MLKILLSALLIASPAPAEAPADSTSMLPSVIGVARAIMGFMSTQSTSAEDTIAVNLINKALDSVESGVVTVPIQQSLPSGTDTSIVARINPATFFLTIPAANYSGIAPLEINGLEGDFLLVDDKSATEGFRKVHLSLDEAGQITAAQDLGFIAASTGATATDGEGIIYNTRRGTVLLAREASNEILEFGLDGKATGRNLHTSSFFPKNANAGLESLTYSPETGRIFTTTEGVPEGGDCLRIQGYAHWFWPSGHWSYKLDKAAVSKPGAIYARGVSELCALPDGSLLVLEREANIPGTSVKEAVGAFVSCKLYRVEPNRTPTGKTLEKHLVTRIDTRAIDVSFANYEGMCLGPTLPNGQKVLILVSDSQAGYKGILRDWFKTIILK